MTNNQVSTLKRGLLVLEAVKEKPGITLSEVMEQFGLSKSTAFRFLTTLEDMNYIYKVRSEYFYNFKLFSDENGGRAASDWTSLRAVYQTAESLQMSTYLGKMDGTDLVMTQVLHAPFLHSADEEIGNRSKVHLSALGKVILAHMEEERLNELLNRMSLEPATENTFQDSQLFRYHLKAIKEDGYAFDDEERNVGIRCVAVPVFRDGKAVAALAIAAPAEEISRTNIRYISTQLHAGGKAVTKEIEVLEAE